MLTVPGFGDVPIRRDGVQERWEVVGDVEPAFSGKARSDISTQTRVWSIRTEFLPSTDAASLMAALQATPPVATFGDLLGGTVNTHPRVVGRNWNGIGEVSVTFELRESDPA